MTADIYAHGQCIKSSFIFGKMNIQNDAWRERKFIVNDDDDDDVLLWRLSSSCQTLSFFFFALVLWNTIIDIN